MIYSSKKREPVTPVQEAAAFETENHFHTEDEPMTLEKFYGFDPDAIGLEADKDYKNFFRDPKIMATFTEHFDITDRETRKCLMSLDEAEQGGLLATLTSKLYDNIISKIDDIDYGDIPNSKGDITELTNYDKLVECTTLLRDILVEFKQDTSPIDEISVAIDNVRGRKELFGRAFKYNVEMPIVMYNNIVLTIISSVSYMIATCIEFMKTPNRDSFQITLDKVAFTKTKNNMLYSNLKKFNKICKSGEFDKAMEHVIQHRVDKMAESAGLVLGLGAVSIVAAGGIFLLIMKCIIPLLREMVFFFYYTRMRVSDFFDIQADLLQMNAHNVESNEAKSEDEKERIVSKQLKIAELFRKIANKISFTGRKAEVESTKAITAESRKMKLGDDGIEMPNTGSALF